MHIQIVQLLLKLQLPFHNCSILYMFVFLFEGNRIQQDQHFGILTYFDPLQIYYADMFVSSYLTVYPDRDFKNRKYFHICTFVISLFSN
jgi:hypothetical protein